MRCESFQLAVVARALFVLLLVGYDVPIVHALSVGQTQSTKPPPSPRLGTTTSFSKTIEANDRMVEETFGKKLERLWNDPRPVNEALLGGDDSDEITLPYRLTTGKFDVQGQTFECILYPRGILDREAVGSAAAYLRYHNENPGDEVDVSWTLRLIDGQTEQPLPVFSSGGLPRSNDTWSCAMTFTSREEGVDSLGRISDWGCSTWSTNDVVKALSGPGQHLRVEGNLTIQGVRNGQSSLSWPFGTKGALGAAFNAVRSARERLRTFRSGEVIVPTRLADQDKDACRRLEQAGIYPGVDYRIMTIADSSGNSIFSTDSISSPVERESARLALRPVGWRLHQQMWEQKGKKVTDWPVEVEASLLSQSTLTRFSPGAYFPRLKSYIKRDAFAVIFSLMVATAPLPLALVGREFVSFYEIPSASMDPTLQKGDVLLVEKFPGTFDRTRRGDVVLFSPPSELQKIIGGRTGSTQGSSSAGFGSGVNPLGGQSLFVKRVVGMPGDVNIKMDELTKEVTVNGERAVGPSRDLCDDEPLRLIDRLLQDGKGANIDQLDEDETFVLGDCKGVSVDSRVWGALPKKNVVGRPVARIWPLNRFYIGSP